MLKAQFPEEHQGANGESVGGLRCEGNRLHLSRAAVTSKLCVPGAQKPRARIRNLLNQVVSICRTNYPGKILQPFLLSGHAYLTLMQAMKP
jgi:SUN family beta-glucosidase